MKDGLLPIVREKCGLRKRQRRQGSGTAKREVFTEHQRSHKACEGAANAPYADLCTKLLLLLAEFPARNRLAAQSAPSPLAFGNRVGLCDPRRTPQGWD
jgi:hypothetical protein